MSNLIVKDAYGLFNPATGALEGFLDGAGREQLGWPGYGEGSSPTTPDVKTPTTLSGTALSITSPLEIVNIAAPTSYTWAAGTPASNTWLAKRFVATGAPRAVTISPGAYSERQQATITTFTVPVGDTTVLFEYTAGGWRIVNDPDAGAYTIAGRPSAVTAGAGAVIAVNDTASGLIGTMVSDGARWCGELVLQQSIPGIKLPSSTIGTGTSGHLTLGTALPAIYSRAWCSLPAVASTPAITAGMYYCEFSSTTVGTIYTAGPGSAAFNFSAGAALTATTATDVNLFVPRRFTGTAASLALGAIIPGGLLGPDGAVHMRFSTAPTNNANAKTIKSKFGAATFHQQSLTTAGSRGSADIVNTGSDAQQAYHGFATDNVSWVEGQTGAMVPVYATEATASDVRLQHGGQVAAATDFLILNRCTARVVCQ
jgi:hypothetical protein